MDKNNMTQNIQNIVIEEFKFEDLSENKQQDLVDMMTDSIIKQILLDAYEELSTDDRKKMEEMMENIEKIQPDEMEVFLREKLTDYDTLVNNAINDLKLDVNKG